MLDKHKSSRNVIPRWRAIAAIESSEKALLDRNLANVHRNEISNFVDELPIWRRESDVTRFSEILDTFALTGHQPLIGELQRLFSHRSEKIPQRLRQSYESIVQLKPSASSVRAKIANLEKDLNYVDRSISTLKSNISEFPRNAFSYLEIARLYTIRGQLDKAENNIIVALGISPDDRIILRSSVQFYDVLGDLQPSLAALRRSSRTRYDPWLMSAEIAASTKLGKGSLVAKSGLRQVDGPLISNSHSELAMALATLEMSNGAKERKVFKLVSAALPNSTENGFAQAVWLCDSSSRKFSDRYPGALVRNDAYEAQVHLCLDGKNFQDAAGFAELWLEDQPFDANALIKYLDVHSIYGVPVATTVQWAKRGVLVHSEDWRVHNAAILVLARYGEFDLAQASISALNKLLPSGPERAFFEAANGYLAYYKGDFLNGRESYLQAIEIARKGKRPDLVADAVMFWLRCEVENGLVSAAVANEIVDGVELRIAKLSESERKFFSSICSATRAMIQRSQSIEGESLNSNLRELTLGQLDDDPIFLI